MCAPSKAKRAYVAQATTRFNLLDAPSRGTRIKCITPKVLDSHMMSRSREIPRSERTRVLINNRLVRLANRMTSSIGPYNRKQRTAIKFRSQGPRRFRRELCPRFKSNMTHKSEQGSENLRCSPSVSVWGAKTTKCQQRSTNRKSLMIYSLAVLALVLLTANYLELVEASKIHFDELKSLSSEAEAEVEAFVPTRAPSTQHVSSVGSTSGFGQPSNISRQVNQRRSLSDESLDSWKAKSGSRSGRSKFERINELDAFLDDMNHDELHAMAVGQPLSGGLLQSFSGVGEQPARESHHKHHTAGASSPTGRGQSFAGHQAAASGQAKQGTSLRVDGGDLNAAVSQNHQQQIYSECALILQRTYVKNIDDPKHQLVPFGKTEQACISYKHIDKAIEEAKHRLKFKEFLARRQLAKAPTLELGPARPPPPPLEVIHSSLEPPEDLIEAIGELNMATTQIIAQQFDLSNDELLNGLPLVDMSKTKFWPFCPMLVRQDLKCEMSRFRSHTGHCNNIKHPTWGAAMTPFARYLPPVHPDGVWAPRKSIVSEHAFEISSHHENSPTQPHPIFIDHEHLSPRGAAGVAGMIGGASRLRNTIGNEGLTPEAELAAEMEPEASVRFASHAPSAGSSLREESEQISSASSPNQEDVLATDATLALGRRARSNPLELPSPRLISSTVHRDMNVPSHDFSILFMSWGQLLDHDMSRAAQPPASIKCCGLEAGQPKHKLCLPIQVPPNDPFYGQFNVQCLEFRRSLAGLRPNCVLGPRVHQNAITSPIDANFVYGSSQAHADALRLFKGGRLRDRDWFKRQGLKPLLPAQDVDPDLECIGRPRDLFCFLAGDVRANEQTHLTVLHTLYMREHNKIADQLAKINPHWDDERLYQETRHIIAAGVQHVMLNEYIPLLIGPTMVDLYNLTSMPYVDEFGAAAGAVASEGHVLHGHGHAHHFHRSRHLSHHMRSQTSAYWHGYDPTVTTSVSQSFAAAAFRQGHTFIQGTVERYTKFHEFVASEKLRHLFKQPFLIYQPGVLDELTSGMINQPSQSYDPFISEDISGHLFQAPASQFGHDLPAINLQRGREQALPGYNLFREWCGLPRAESFEQLEPYLTNHTAFQYSRLYKHVDDIDLWSGGISERKLPGAAIGPTFACIIARQFSNTRRGDRFWYENPGFPSSFTPGQLNEIRKVTLAKILCSNSDDLPTIQRWALRMPHPVLNERVNCDQLPSINLLFWQEEL